MRNIKVALEYDGSEFCGWQWQPKGRSVQGVLQQAAEELLRESVKVVGAGRTDAGVHALGQVANFKSSTRLNLRAIRLGLNSYLPADLRVIDASEVDDRFHARFSAVSRTYRYVLSTRMRAVARQYSWFCKYKLEVKQIEAASKLLLGKHAFVAFSKHIETEQHYLCDLKQIRWEVGDGKLVMEVTANRFLHNMVRIIVGTMVDVGREKLRPGDVGDILNSGDRSRVGSTAPPHGLFLVTVNYQ